MGVMGRANVGAGSGVGSGEPFLNKDELIRWRTPLAIVNVEYDRFGSAQYRTPRWVLTVEAWDPNFPIPDSAYPADRDVEAQGLVTFGDSEVRQSQFGTGRDEQGQPIGISAQLEDARAQGLEWIGPVAVVNGRSNKGSPFKTLADVQLIEDGSLVLDGAGFPVIIGAPEQTSRRQTAPPPAAAAAPPAATPVRQARRSTGQRARAATPPTPPAVPQAAQTLTDVPPAAVPANQATPPRVRRATTPATASAAPQAPAANPTPAAPRRGRPPAQQALSPQTPPAASPEAYEAQQQAQERRNPTATGPAPGVREVTDVTVQEAEATCPFCNTEITGRLYPAAPEGFARAYAESARAFGWPELTPEQKAAGGQVIPHPHCPMLQQTIMLPYVQMEGE